MLRVLSGIISVLIMSIGAWLDIRGDFNGDHTAGHFLIGGGILLWIAVIIYSSIFDSNAKHDTEISAQIAQLRIAVADANRRLLNAQAQSQKALRNLDKTNNMFGGLDARIKRIQDGQHSVFGG